MANINVDFGKMFSRTRELVSLVSEQSRSAVSDVAEEVLRLSQFEVPLRKGSLKDSGHTERIGPLKMIVGYNKVYAARLHEHPEYHFRNGRKGKYLEDPIKNNLSTLRAYIQKSINI